MRGYKRPQPAVGSAVTWLGAATTRTEAVPIWCHLSRDRKGTHGKLCLNPSSAHYLPKSERLPDSFGLYRVPRLPLCKEPVT